MSRPKKAAAAEHVQTPAPAGEFQLIPLSRITASPSNPRRNFDETKLAELAESVKEKGILEPVLLRPAKGWEVVPGKQSGKPGWFVENVSMMIQGHFNADRKKVEPFLPLWEIVAGERRYSAAKIAGLEHIPAITRSLSDRDALEIQVIENLQRQDLTAIEEAEGYQILLAQHGYTAETLAAKIGKSRAYVYGRLKLCDLPDIARKLLESGNLNQSVAQLIARIPNPDLREVAAQEVCDVGPPQYQHEPMSFREAKDYIESEFMVELKSAPFTSKDANLLPAAGACVTCPKISGNDRDLYPEGRADICNDPACYKLKVEAHAAQLVKAAGENGYRILSKKENEQLFYSKSLRYNAPYFDMADQCHDDPKRRSYKQLLGDQVTPVVGQDGDGVIHYLAPKAEAAKVLKAAGIKSSSSSPSTGLSAAEKKRKEEEKLKSQVRSLSVTEACGLVAEAAERRATNGNPFLRILAGGFLHSIWGDAIKLTCHRRNVEVIKETNKRGTTPDYQGSLHTVIDGMSEIELAGLLSELVLARMLDSYRTSSYVQLDNFANEYLAHFGIDITVISKRIETELKVKAEEKKQPRAKKDAKAKTAQAV